MPEQLQQPDAQQKQLLTLDDVITQCLAPVYSYAYEANEQISSAIALQQTVAEGVLFLPSNFHACIYALILLMCKCIHRTYERINAPEYINIDQLRTHAKTNCAINCLFFSRSYINIDFLHTHA